MTTDLQPYPRRKDSGLPWLGQIPAHWDVRRNGRLFAQRNETGHGNLPILEVSLKTGVRVRDMDNMKRKQVMSDREKYKRAAKGDIAYNMMRMWQGAVGVAPEDGLVSPAYVVARPYLEAEPRYFSYLFRTDAYKNEVDGFSRGIVKDRNRLYWEDFKRMPSCFPLPDEQKAIADYLDATAVKVRRFIRNRRRLIEVLNEQKQAIINRVVTRGLDSSAPLKPSGIDWLGDVPEHWRLMKLRAILKPIAERNRPDLPLLSVVREKGVIIRDVEDIEGNHNYIPDDLSNYKVVRSGQFAMNKMKAWQGSYGISDHEGIVSPAYFVFNLTADIHLQFFHLALRSRVYVPFFTRASDGVRTGQWDLSIPRMKEIPFLVPPPDEQEAIAALIPQATEVLSQATDKSQREIDLIREYRTRLIADVVTGKVDVRGLAPAEPLQADEQIDENIENDEMMGDDEPELVEEVDNA